MIGFFNFGPLGSTSPAVPLSDPELDLSPDFEFDATLIVSLTLTIMLALI